ncbi:MAG: cytochrome c [Acidimicrobiia bacterium]|nr:cytochrome c [Acidimicrobiia bacterium]NNL47484.1 cytochrome c [Acidimicrobiia bacterium]
MVKPSLRRKRLFVAGVFLLAALAAGCGGETALDGSTIYANQCARCHGSAGQGGSGPALGSGGRIAALDDATVRDVIVTGRRGTAMPAYSGLSETQLTNLVQHLRQLP